nr:hypothetical protein [Pedobacter sp. ASV19]
MNRGSLLLFWSALAAFLLPALSSPAQKNYKVIPLPQAINSINEEFSGMSLYDNRLYLLPQYGSHKESKLDSAFNIYSLHTDSVSRVIDGKDTALTAFKTIKVRNLNQLPDSVKAYYEGFEAIIVLKDQVFLSIETNDNYDYCFLLKGKLDKKTAQIFIDPTHFISIKRYPYIKNAGFESLTYLPAQNKLLTIYEFNGMENGGRAYLIDTALKKEPERISVPFLPFRITDIQATHKGQIYGINYYWNGDYDAYLDNNILRHEEGHLKELVPDLRDSLNQNPDYLKEKTTYYARIVMLANYKATSWKPVTSFDPKKNNWEGISLFRKGALTITDANRSKKQLTTLAYFDFP